jgi:hypothetical protein
MQELSLIEQAKLETRKFNLITYSNKEFALIYKDVSLILHYSEKNQKYIVIFENRVTCLYNINRKFLAEILDVVEYMLDKKYIITNART